MRGVNYATSPLLASKTPNWRSRFIVAAVGLGFAGLLGRAAYIQLIRPDFFQKEGEKRYSQVLDAPGHPRPHPRPQPASCWPPACRCPASGPSPRTSRPRREQRAQVARLLGMDRKEFDSRMASGSNNFAWIKRQADPEAVWAQVKALGLKGLHESREYRRRYPEGESAAHVVGFTNLDDQGQEGIELAFQQALQGKKGQQGVAEGPLRPRGRRHGRGRGARPMAATWPLSLDAKVQFFAYQRVRDAVAEHKAKAGSVVVLDVQTGEVLALANYPSFNPGERGHLNGRATAQPCADRHLRARLDDEAVCRRLGTSRPAGSSPTR